MKAKIVWVHDDFDGPYNGVATLDEVENKIFWFKRIGYDYDFIELTEDQGKFLLNCHIDYCKEMGKPIYHGDPYIIKSNIKLKKIDFEKETSSLSEDSKPSGYEGTTRGLDTVVKAQHSFNSEEIVGEPFITLTEKDFINFHIPRKTIFV